MDFPENYNDTNLCNVEFPLNPGAECDASVNFMPTVSGPLSEDVTLKDNNLAGANVTQLIPVRSTAVASITLQAINFTQPAAVTYAPGLTVSLVATGGASGNPVVFTIAGGTGTGTISEARQMRPQQAPSSSMQTRPETQTTPLRPRCNRPPLSIRLRKPSTSRSRQRSHTLPASPLHCRNRRRLRQSSSLLHCRRYRYGHNNRKHTDCNHRRQLRLRRKPGRGTQTTPLRPRCNRPPLSIRLRKPSPSPSPPPITYSAPGLTSHWTATGGASGNPVVFLHRGGGTGTGTISGKHADVTTPGTFIIDANQAGNANYSAAPQVQQTAVVIRLRRLSTSRSRHAATYARRPHRFIGRNRRRIRQPVSSRSPGWHRLQAQSQEAR